ncbi:MAG: hypothetical protein RIQ89_951 [Bacteroidota bacterium]|jgi:uncharacterized protein (DUF983 family)
MLVFKIIRNMVLNKCPRCGLGQLFTFNNPYRIKGALKMEAACSHCNEIYEKEPGNFYGAMYVSYALTTGWFMVNYALYAWVFTISAAFFLSYIAISIILLSPLTFRWSRSLWISFFIKRTPPLS